LRFSRREARREEDGIGSGRVEVDRDERDGRRGIRTDETSWKTLKVKHYYVKWMDDGEPFIYSQSDVIIPR
jgi:hypothetical protein